MSKITIAEAGILYGGDIMLAEELILRAKRSDRMPKPKIEIIAEIGINHNGDMKQLEELILQARKCGCTIIKTQLYDPVKLFPDKEILVQGKNWYPEVEKTKLTKEQLFQFAEWCREVGAEPMASAYDLERLAWLEEIGVKRHKVGSRMNRNKEYIEAVSKTNKEILLSCRRPYHIYEIFGHILPPILRNNTKWLYCIPHYPTLPNELEFNEIYFPLEFQGFSDHTIGIGASKIALSRGAQIIEKHFCLKRDNSNPDMSCSITPSELKELVNFARKVEEIL